MTPLNIGISETIRDHLIKQKARAVTKRADWTEEKPTFYCRYRGDNGTSCAVGCLIPDSRYDDKFEGEPVYGNVYAQDLRQTLRDLYPGVDLGMLAAWQRYHDGELYQSWCADEEGAVSPDKAFQQITEGK